MIALSLGTVVTLAIAAAVLIIAMEIILNRFEK
jgi:hypothetical protein